jgi:hypothetical protein
LAEENLQETRLPGVSIRHTPPLRLSYPSREVTNVLGTIFAVFVVVAIFCLVASLFTIYVWCVDPRRRAARRAALQARRQAHDTPAA